MDTQWRLAGDYFEACNCDIACPCVFTSDPTHGACTVLIGWHIAQGKSGNETLDGLNFALAAFSPGNMLTTKWEVGVYIDERATPNQREALGAIIGGRAGGSFGALAPLIGKVHGMKFVPIEFKRDGKKHSLRIRGIGEMNSEAIEGSSGGTVKIAGAPLLLVPEVTVAKADVMSLSDYGWTWESKGGNSFYSAFDLKGP
ncbi:MAG TPA: DUF1326 domain-containing protein [Thermoplasmata archaeon]|nr:DUF1326 domain-containing protein [Thermoplasmata archaeon]